MKVNDDKFNEAVHHPLKTARLINDLIKYIQSSQVLYLKMGKIANDLAEDLKQYRKELLESVEEV